MMQVVTGKEMRLLEQKAIQSLGVSELMLMENAGSKIVEVLTEEYGCPAGKRIHILAGVGNNGGDGLVAARHLLLKSARPKVYLVGNPEKRTSENRINLEILRKLGADLVSVKSGQDEKLRFGLGMSDLIIDAVLGTGFSGKLSAELSALADIVNEIKRSVVAVDIPTGVDASSGLVEGSAVRADLTICLGLMKVGCLLYPGRDYAGRSVVADLGIPLSGESAPSRYLIGPSILNLLPRRQPWGHKGTFGHTLVVGGSKMFAGAPSLCGRAVLRGGGGMVTVAVPRSIVSRFPPDELIVVPVEDSAEGAFSTASLPELLELAAGKDVLVVGPGLSGSGAALEAAQGLLQSWNGPAVIDADALQALRPEFLKSIPPAQRRRWVITPHPGEMARLIGETAEQVNRNRLGTARQWARKWDLVLVLKGAPTIISGAEKTYINSSGSDGLATAGTGDVLAGLIGALLAQGLEPLAAAAVGVYAHGAAGDLAGKGRRGLKAGDCLETLPQILK